MGTRVLVTGASGYIGGRLVPRLLDEGFQVRAMSRDGARLKDLPWASETEIVDADALKPVELAAAMKDIDVAYYLVHSIGAGANFEDTDRLAAQNFAQAARDAGVKRIVYLGGLTPADQELSRHLSSRSEVADILLASGVPTAALQAAVIIGSGSASFEMLRYLTERLPAMITPRWVDNKIQPIAIRDVLPYLIGAATLPAEVSRRFDIGGPEVLTYGEMMQRYAKAAGLRRRLLIKVPVLTPSLSSWWVNLVTPVPGRIARPIIQSLINDTICREHDIKDYIPDPEQGLLPVEDAIRLALQRIGEAAVETRWSSAAWVGAPSEPLPNDPHWAGGSLYADVREKSFTGDRQRLWDVIEGIGGDNGWYSLPFAWELRGWMDRVVGGVGLRRGRRDPQRLYVGEALDFWRVEQVEPGELLRLRAEMKVPGQAWLELAIEQSGPVVQFKQRALFVPHGLAGHLYWWSVAPFHGIIFESMANNIVASAAG